MKTKLVILSLAVLALVLSGCTLFNKNKTGVGDVVSDYNAAQELGEDMSDPNKISSEENIENLYNIMNYQGTQSKEEMKSAIRQGMDDGKNQGELNKDIITSQDLGAGYMIGYVFGCNAVTGDEDQCNTDMGTKYQTIMMEELQKQMPTMVQ